MTSSSYSSATLPVQGMGRPSDAAEAAWMHAFFNGRIAVLGLGFAVLPLALALAPGQLNGAVPVVLAGLLSATLGLIGLRYGSGPVALAASAGGLAFLAFGPWLGGLAGATAGAGLVSLALEAAALPASRRMSPLALGALLGSAALIGLTALVSDAATAPSLQAAVAALVLPLAPAVTLMQVARSSRAAFDARDASATTAARRDAILIAAADVAVAVVDRGAHVLDVSDAAVRLLACTPPDLGGRGLIDRVLIAERPALLKAVSDAVMAGRESTVTVHMSDGAVRAAAPRFAPYDLLVRPVAEGTGQASIRLLAAAERPRAPECRARLFAALSHEVRTPMNAILGFSEILANPALQPKTPEQVAEYASIVHKSASEAFAVTRAVVDLLRVESADFVADPEKIDVRELVRKIAATASEKSPCHLDVTGTDFEVMADPRCLRMAITGLVEAFANAGGTTPVVCRLSNRGSAVSIALSCAAEAPTGRLGHAAYLGVVEALVRKISALTGLEFSLSISEQALSAHLSLPVDAEVVTPLHPAVEAPQSPNVLPLRRVA